MSHRYLILGLLADEPMTGYDIKKRVAVDASDDSLYPTLHRLVKEGSVEVQEIPRFAGRQK